MAKDSKLLSISEVLTKLPFAGCLSIFLIASMLFWLLGITEGRYILICIFVASLFLVYHVGMAVRRKEAANESRRLVELLQLQKETVEIATGVQFAARIEQWPSSRPRNWLSSQLAIPKQ
jgi:hypothetical protein